MKNMPIYILSFMVLLFSTQLQAEEHADTRKIKAKAIADEITDLRSVRAASLLQSGKAVTPDVFKEVCGPVKKRAMEIAKKEGVKIRHAAIKNRNPAHAASDEEKNFHSLFAGGMETEIWDETTIDKAVFARYVRPIYVEPACLSCHGVKDERPAFIKKKYPEDLAYGFQPGDLRGIIEVMVPVKN